MNFRLYTISSHGFFKKEYLIDENEEPRYDIKKTNWFVQEYEMINRFQEEVYSIHFQFKFLGASYSILKNGKHIALVEKEPLENTLTVQTEHHQYFIQDRYPTHGITFVKGIEEIGKMSFNLDRKSKQVKVAILDTEDQQLILALAFIMTKRLYKEKKKDEQRENRRDESRRQRRKSG